MTEQRVGLEQEFFLVDEAGASSDRADEFLWRCRKMAERAGLDPEGLAGECGRGMVEISTPPASSVEELVEAYLERLDLALRAGRELGVRLYPLATYPLPIAPPLRKDLNYELQALTLGLGRFLNAARHTGVHLHLEVPEGIIGPGTVVSGDAPESAREEMLNLYNLGTALDPALVTPTRSCPFYEGLIERQLSSYEAWLAAMDRAGVERRLFFEAGGNILKASWNPVRINRHETVELRGIDSNYPETVLAIAALVQAAADRVRNESLTVEPDERPA